MVDLIYVLLTAGFFALAVVFVYACDRIIGPDLTEDAVVAEEHRPDDGPKVVVEVGA